MALKTFNVDHEVYKEFAEHCKKEGISMSKRVEKFISGEIKKIKQGTGMNDMSVAEEKVKGFVEEKEDLSVKSGEHSFMKYC